MPTVTIDGRTVEVEVGTNLIEAAKTAGVQIPHYCYHPRLSVVGQCRMCLVKIDGMPKLQAGCTTQVMKDGMVVLVDDEEVKQSQEGIMEFFLINHPLDCPICDQAGECGLQDYSFKHGQAFSRFRYEDKRTYPGKQRIPLGPTVLLNMNRCIQCTRCVRFTEEITGTGELGFFQRGARAEIGVFPGRELDSDLATNVVDICPVGALTSTRFRFAERVWYLDKRPSLCTGCDAGCNITIEHRQGTIRRYKPRVNPEVNDHWMCDYGRESFEPYVRFPRLGEPRVAGGGDEPPRNTSWEEAIDLVASQLQPGDLVAFLGSGSMTTEEAFLLRRLADVVDSPHRSTALEPGESEHHIPNPSGGVSGTEASPNRRGAELAGLRPEPGAISADDLLAGNAAEACSFLFVADSDRGFASKDPDVVERLRKADFLVVMGWADSALARVADVCLPAATPAERSGSFVNSQFRLQRFDAAFPPPAPVRPALEILADILVRFDPAWSARTAPDVFAELGATIEAFNGTTLEALGSRGVTLDVNDSSVAGDRPGA